MMPQRNKCKEISSPETQTQPPSPKHEPNMPSSSSSSSTVDYFSSPFYPLGVKFVPSDEDIIFILNYWKSFPEEFINSFPNLPVYHVNIYESNPQQLSEEYKKGNLKEWFFISERTKTNKGGKRQKRGDNGGYWHATVASKMIEAGEDIVCYKTALDYFVGIPSNSVKSNWLMHEYWLEPSHDNDNEKVDYSLCKIYLSPKKKKKQESVQDSEVEVKQPTNVASQQPLQPQAEEQHQLPLSSSSSSSWAVDCISSPFHQPGYKFVPNNEDIIFILNYWKTFPEGYMNSWPYFPVYHVNIYESNPQQLSVEYKKGNLKEWFFISERTCKGGKRQKRGDNGGYWHATAATKTIKDGEDIVGYKTALAYYVGKTSNGVKTDWLMHEYWLEPKPSQDNEAVAYSLCKIYLTPMAKKKKKEEEGVEASQAEVEQLSNVAFQQPQEQEQQPSYVAFQQPQPIDVAFQQPLVQQQQPSNVALQHPHQPEFCQSPLDSLQPQAHEQHEPPMPFISDELYEILNSHNIPDDVDGFFPYYDEMFSPSRDGDRFLEQIAREGVKNHNTLLI